MSGRTTPAPTTPPVDGRHRPVHAASAHRQPVRLVTATPRGGALRPPVAVRARPAVPLPRTASDGRSGT